jgi:predicted MFS family arabinose efflux permease
VVSDPQGLRRLLALICAVQIADVAIVSALAPLLPLYAERFGFAESESGIVVAAFAAGALLSALPAGALCSRIGVKPTMLLGLALMAIGSVWFGLAASTVELETARFVQGFASSVAWTGAISWLTAAAPPGRRGRLLGVAMAATVGGVLAGPALGVLAAAVGTAPTFAGFAVFTAALACLGSLLPGPPAARQPMRAAFGALRNRRLILGTWLFLLPAFLIAAQGAIAPLRLAELGWGAGGIGAIYVTAAGVQASTNMLLGRWLDRTHVRVPVTAALTAASLVAVLLALPWTGSHWSFALLVGAASVAFTAFYLPGSALVAEGADAAGIDHALGFSLANLAWAPGTVIGSTTGGALAERAGAAATYVLLTAVCVATLAALWWLAPRGAVAQARS